MWTEITRPNYERRGGRYASDLTDREWALIAPLMPPRKKIGRPRTTDLRHVMDAVMYALCWTRPYRARPVVAICFSSSPRRARELVEVRQILVRLREGRWCRCPLSWRYFSKRMASLSVRLSRRSQRPLSTVRMKSWTA